MKILNLEKVKKTKRAQIVKDYCGGQFSRQEAISAGGIGIGGLHYEEGAELVDNIKKLETLRSNVESYKEGFGFYLRENEGNYLLLLKYSDILNISFYKNEDILNEKPGFSLFKSCLKRGIPYHYAKLMLMEDEIKEMHQPKLKIVTTDLDEINFICTRKNPLKIRNYFRSLPLDDKFLQEYMTYSFA